MPNLSSTDRKIVTQELRALPARIEEAKQKEMGEMMGKLKEVSSCLEVCYIGNIYTEVLRLLF